MEISRISNTTKITNEGKRGVESKKDFSQSFNFAQQQRSEQELKQMLDDIAKKGSRLKASKCYADVEAYKDKIKEYLKSVLEYMYTVKKDISFWQTQYYVRVETINEKLEELTEMFVKNQHENIEIASKIDEITGLVVDIYR